MWKEETASAFRTLPPSSLRSFLLPRHKRRVVRERIDAARAVLDNSYQNCAARLQHPQLLKLLGLLERQVVTLIEAALWLGLVPLAAYAASYWPNFLYAERAIAPDGLIEWHRYMLELQGQVVRPHPYMSVWYQWVGNWRPI